MSSIAFIDTEIEPRSHKILDIGGIKSDGSSFHDTSIPRFINFLSGSQFICGHNVLKHDIKFIGNELKEAGIQVGAKEMLR